MDKEFYNNILKILDKSSINFKKPELGRYLFKEQTRFFSSEIEVINSNAKLSETPAILCLIVFTLLDIFLENKYEINAGFSFSKKYKALPTRNDQEIIEKECYRIIKTMRNGYVHNISNISNNNGKYYFKYVSPQDTLFKLNITEDKLILLYTLIVYLVKGEYEIKTYGHFIGALREFYDELLLYINEDNFKDDINRPLKSISNSTRIKFGTRWKMEDTTFYVKNNKIKINSIYNYKDKKEFTDYFLEFNKEKYIIPEEVLDKNNSIKLNKLADWKQI